MSRLEVWCWGWGRCSGQPASLPRQFIGTGSECTGPLHRGHALKDVLQSIQWHRSGRIGGLGKGPSPLSLAECNMNMGCICILPGGMPLFNTCIDMFFAGFLWWVA